MLVETPGSGGAHSSEEVSTGGRRRLSSEGMTTLYRHVVPIVVLVDFGAIVGPNVAADITAGRVDRVTGRHSTPCRSERRRRQCGLLHTGWLEHHRRRGRAGGRATSARQRRSRSSSGLGGQLGWFDRQHEGVGTYADTILITGHRETRGGGRWRDGQATSEGQMQVPRTGRFPVSYCPGG